MLNRNKENTQATNCDTVTPSYYQGWPGSGDERDEISGLWSVTMAALIRPGYQCGPLISDNTLARLTCANTDYISY